jgi:hypothetical protein
VGSALLGKFILDYHILINLRGKSGFMGSTKALNEVIKKQNPFLKFKQL